MIWFTFWRSLWQLCRQMWIKGMPEREQETELNCCWWLSKMWWWLSLGYRQRRLRKEDGSGYVGRASEGNGDRVGSFALWAFSRTRGLWILVGEFSGSREATSVHCGWMQPGFCLISFLWFWWADSLFLEFSCPFLHSYIHLFSKC